MRRLLSFLRDEAGATLVEAALVFPLVLILTFGLVELGHAYWEYHAVEKATAVGARWLVAGHGVEGNSTTAGELYTTVVPDCFVTTTDPPGTPCSQVAGKSAWGPSCTGAGVAPCDTTTMSGLLAQMRQYAPFLTAANVKVQFSPSEMGFVGRGRAIPFISVQTTGLTYSFIGIDKLLGFGAITMPSFTSTLVAEDQKQGPGI